MKHEMIMVKYNKALNKYNKMSHLIFFISTHPKLFFLEVQFIFQSSDAKIYYVVFHVTQERVRYVWTLSFVLTIFFLFFHTDETNSTDELN